MQSFAGDASTSNKLGLFITGLSGSHQFKTYFDQAPKQIQKILLLNNFGPEELVRFSEEKVSSEDWGEQAVSEKKNLVSFFRRVSKREQPYDQVFIFLGGHANGRDEEALLHLPGSDIQFKVLMEGINNIPAKTMTIVIAAPQGESWIKNLARPGRTIIVGNGYRQYDFIPMLFLRTFPEMFEKAVKTDAFGQPAMSVSLRDIFIETQRRIRHWYKVNHLHVTEMALLDADGDGKGESLFKEESLDHESQSQGKVLPDQVDAPAEESEEFKETVREKPPVPFNPKPVILDQASEQDIPMRFDLPDAKAAEKISFVIFKGELKP